MQLIESFQLNDEVRIPAQFQTQNPTEIQTPLPIPRDDPKVERN
jgi:hypothetical protein